MKNKVDCGKYPLIYPLPIALIGSLVDGKANCAPIGNCGIVSVEFAVVYISIHKDSHTTKGILAENEFSINFASSDKVKEVDKAGLISGKNVDKSQLFNYFYEAGNKVPMIEDCAINILCKVISKTEIHNQIMFVAEVMKTYATESCCSNGYADTQKINPIIYTMDNQYWTLGKNIGTGFEVGKELL